MKFPIYKDCSYTYSPIIFLATASDPTCPGTPYSFFISSMSSALHILGIISVFTTPGEIDCIEK